MIIGSKIRNAKKVELSENAYPVLFAHVGVGDYKDIDLAIEVERNKIKGAIEAGADIICDVSMSDNIKYVHEKLLEGFNIPFGTVSIYEAYIASEKDDLKFEEKEFIRLFKEQVLRGFDIITIHATVFKDDRELINNSKRLIPTTSRGGMLMLKMLEVNGYENPYFTHFDEILAICKEYDVSLSLGPCYRPASVCDCKPTDELILLELERMSILCKKAIENGVGITIEGIGHATLDMIPKMIQLAKEKCYNVPYRVMTVATDIALGYDHISSAIASANAIYHGADSVTAVTRSEHLGIPTYEEVIEGVKAAKVAIYSGYIAKTGNTKRDMIMSKTREASGCIGHIPSTLFPNEVIKTNKRKNKSCSMCGDYCPLNDLGGDD